MKFNVFRRYRNNRSFRALMLWWALLETSLISLTSLNSLKSFTCENSLSSHSTDFSVDIHFEKAAFC